MITLVLAGNRGSSCANDPKEIVLDGNMHYYNTFFGRDSRQGSREAKLTMHRSAGSRVYERRVSRQMSHGDTSLHKRAKNIPMRRQMDKLGSSDGMRSS
jgi:hypothetical protein